MNVSLFSAAKNSASTTDTTGSGSASILPTKTLGQQDFLNLLITQLKSQDPLNPQKDTEFIAQMAQFSTLEQSKSMENTLSSMRSDQQMLQANSLIGRNVMLQTGKDTTTLGTVSAADLTGTSPQIVVDGKSYDLSAVLGIYNTSAQLSNN